MKNEMRITRLKIRAKVLEVLQVKSFLNLFPFSGSLSFLSVLTLFSFKKLLSLDWGGGGGDLHVPLCSYATVCYFIEGLWIAKLSTRVLSKLLLR